MTSHLSITTEDKRQIPLEVLPDGGSQFVINEIFHKHCYAAVSFIGEVKTVMDIGANLGLASAWFRNCYPAAAIHAFEPDPRAIAVLERNAAAIGGVTVYPYGLYDRDCIKKFYVGKASTVHNSIFSNSLCVSEPCRVELKDAGKFVRNRGLEAAEVVKIDTEGCELPILKSLGDAITRFKVIYLEFHSEQDRRELDNMLSVSHQLYSGEVICGHRGQYTFVRRDLLDNQTLKAEELR